MTNIRGAYFCETFCGIDIWGKTDTISGTSTYFIDVDGTTHERYSKADMLNLIKFITNTRRSK